MATAFAVVAAAPVGFPAVGAVGGKNAHLLNDILGSARRAIGFGFATLQVKHLKVFFTRTALVFEHWHGQSPPDVFKTIFPKFFRPSM